MTLAQELENLEQMRNRGALSEDEFAQAKARLLQPTPVAPLTRVSALNGLRRSATDQWIGGVCGGLSNFTGMDAWLWRLVFSLMLILGGTGLLLYVLLWILVPLESTNYRTPLSPNH